MKKIIFIILISMFTNAAMANFNIPSVPSESFYEHYQRTEQARENIKRQQLENQMIQQRIDMIRQQQAMMEIQRRNYVIQQNQTYEATNKSTNLTDYNDRKISDSLENHAIGHSTHWWDPNTGIKYTITPKNNTAYRGNHNCRTYRVIIQSNKKKIQINNLACRLNNGTWIRIEKR